MRKIRLLSNPLPLFSDQHDAQRVAEAVPLGCCAPALDVPRARGAGGRGHQPHPGDRHLPARGLRHAPAGAQGEQDVAGARR